jgi:hypothetical protein
MAEYPHCDTRVLHQPGSCEYCDLHPGQQQARVSAGIAFTGCAPLPGQLPCPADEARPAGSPSDHRRWGGNTATSKRGDPSQPRQTTASVIFYGDQGGREDWPLPERILRRLRRPLENWRKRRQGFRREGVFWVRRP